MGIPGQTGIAAFLTDITCGEACWEAREDVCHCCCGGKNHGVMRSANGVQPERTAKIDGYRYKLIAVGDYGDIYHQAKDLLKTPYRTETIKCHDGQTITYNYWHSETEPSSPARVKAATKSQCEKWSELTAWRDTTKDNSFVFHRPYLLWQRIEELKDIKEVTP